MSSAPLLDRVDVVLDHWLRNAETIKAGSDIFNAFLCHSLSPCPIAPTRDIRGPRYQSGVAIPPILFISINLWRSASGTSAAMTANPCTTRLERSTWPPVPKKPLIPPASRSCAGSLPLQTLGGGRRKGVLPSPPTIPRASYFGSETAKRNLGLDGRRWLAGQRGRQAVRRGRRQGGFC